MSVLSEVYDILFLFFAHGGSIDLLIDKRELIRNKVLKVKSSDFHTNSECFEVVSKEKTTDWGWYREKVVCYKESKQFCMNPAEMKALLNALGAEMKNNLN